MVGPNTTENGTVGNYRKFIFLEKCMWVYKVQVWILIIVKLVIIATFIIIEDIVKFMIWIINEALGELELVLKPTEVQTESREYDIFTDMENPQTESDSNQNAPTMTEHEPCIAASEGLWQKFVNRENHVKRYVKYSQSRKSVQKPFNMTDLLTLHQRAQSHINKHKYIKIAPIFDFYRVKSREYFGNILLNYEGQMLPYEKTYNGDPCCPINGQIDGLFFSGTVDDQGNLPAVSPFGDTRLTIPVYRMFNDLTNLYFADFYCVNKECKPHYVVVVITEPHSMADIFCRETLLMLDKYNNPYLWIHEHTGQVTINQALRVHIFYTEMLDLKTEQKFGARLQTGLTTIGMGHSLDIGVPKNKDCKECNL